MDSRFQVPDSRFFVNGSWNRTSIVDGISGLFIYFFILFYFILFATLITKNIGKEEEEEKKRSGEET